MKKIICFGGGNAMPKAVLPGLKKYPVKITTITSMTDNGGSTGQLRKNFNILPPGDIRRHLIALSDAPEWKKKLFSFRFGSEEFDNGYKGHVFGNIFLAGLEIVLNDYEKVLEIAHNFLEIKNHAALPATLGKTTLYAELENKKIIEGEDEIDVPRNHSGKLKIKKIFLRPEVDAYHKVVREINEADLIIIGPGDLYSSIIPCFLPNGIKEAIKKSKAKKVFICPLLTKFGETDDFSILDFANEIEGYIECALDYVLYNKTNKEKRAKINKKAVGININLNENKFVGCDFLDNNGEIIHDPDKVAKNLIKLIQT